MSEMIERVAAAVNRSAHCDWRPETCNAGVCQCKVLARAVIEAMREPTERMIEDGMWSRSQSGRYSPRDIATTIYNAMIDAALNEKPPAQP